MAFRRCAVYMFFGPIFVLLTLVPSTGAAHGRVRRQAGWMNQDLNVVMDRLIPNITQQFHLWNVDPLYLNNLHSEDLSDCWLYGLSSAYRSGACYFQSVDPSTTLVIANIGFESLSGSCSFYKKILFLRYYGHVSMQMRDLTTYVRISQPMLDDASPTLEFLDVVVPANMQVEASGSNTVSLVVNTIELLYKRHLRQLVRLTLLEKLQSIMEQYLAQITLGDINEAFRLQQPQMLFNSSSIHITMN